MKNPILISLALAAVMRPTLVSAATPETPNAPPAPVVAAPAPLPEYSPPVRDVVKMVKAGVPEGVIKAFIENSASTFNLTAENIIHLRELGVSESLSADMLGHDKAQRDRLSLQGPPTPPPTYSPNVGSATAPVADDSAVYDNLAPYGYWTDVPSYGWCWQPYSWVGYDYYPWGWLGFGFWWNCPGRGWCWFPHSRFSHFDPIRRFDAFHGRGGFAINNRLAGTRFNGGQFHTRAVSGPAAVRGSTAISHGAAGLRASSPWASGFSGSAGFRGGGVSSFHGGGGAVGFRGGGGGSFHGGGGGGFHAGGGGGFHGGGGGHGGGGHR